MSLGGNPLQLWLATSLAAGAYVFVFSGGSLLALASTYVLVFLTPLLSLLRADSQRIEIGSLTVWAILSILLVLNLVFNSGNYFGQEAMNVASLQVLGIIGILFTLQWATTNLDPLDLMQRLSLLLWPLIAIAIAVALKEGLLIRASPFGLHPNWWGEVGFAFAVTALSQRGSLLRTMYLLTAFALFLLVQSRGALLATIVSIVLYGFLTSSKIRKTHERAVVILVVCVVLLCVLTISKVGFLLWDWLVSNVLLLNDPYRGLESKLTGRLGGWEQAWEIFQTNPLMGQGIGTLRTVHNGFLQVAGEGGLLITAPLLGLLAISTYRAVRDRNHLTLSIIAGYTTYAMTYPRMLNMNLASVMFYLCLFAWSHASTKNGSVRAPSEEVSGYFPREVRLP